MRRGPWVCVRGGLVPCGGAHIAGHDPAGARVEGWGEDLWAFGGGDALELLGEEALEEDVEPALDDVF